MPLIFFSWLFAALLCCNAGIYSHYLSLSISSSSVKVTLKKLALQKERALSTPQYMYPFDLPISARNEYKTLGPTKPAGVGRLLSAERQEHQADSCIHNWHGVVRHK